MTLKEFIEELRLFHIGGYGDAEVFILDEDENPIRVDTFKIDDNDDLIIS